MTEAKHKILFFSSRCCTVHSESRQGFHLVVFVKVPPTLTCQFTFLLLTEQHNPTLSESYGLNPFLFLLVLSQRLTSAHNCHLFCTSDDSSDHLEEPNSSEEKVNGW